MLFRYDGGAGAFVLVDLEDEGSVGRNSCPLSPWVSARAFVK